MRIGVLILLASAFVCTPLSLASAAGLIPCNGPDCTLSDLIGLGNNVIEFLIYLGTLIAVVLIAIGGFKLLTSQGNAGAMEEAKGRIWNVFVGLLIMLLAWLVIQTILTVFTGGGFDVWRI